MPNAPSHSNPNAVGAVMDTFRSLTTSIATTTTTAGRMGTTNASGGGYDASSSSPSIASPSPYSAAGAMGSPSSSTSNNVGNQQRRMPSLSSFVERSLQHQQQQHQHSSDNASPSQLTSVGVLGGRSSTSSPHMQLRKGKGGGQQQQQQQQRSGSQNRNSNINHTDTQLNVNEATSLAITAMGHGNSAVILPPLPAAGSPTPSSTNNHTAIGVGGPTQFYAGPTTTAATMRRTVSPPPNTALLGSSPSGGNAVPSGPWSAPSSATAVAMHPNHHQQVRFAATGVGSAVGGPGRHHSPTGCASGPHSGDFPLPLSAPHSSSVTNASAASSGVSANAGEGRGGGGGLDPRLLAICQALDAEVRIIQRRQEDEEGARRKKMQQQRGTSALDEEAMGLVGDGGGAGGSGGPSPAVLAASEAMYSLHLDASTAAVKAVLFSGSNSAAGGGARSLHPPPPPLSTIAKASPPILLSGTSASFLGDVLLATFSTASAYIEALKASNAALSDALGDGAIEQKASDAVIAALKRKVASYESIVEGVDSAAVLRGELSAAEETIARQSDAIKQYAVIRRRCEVVITAMEEQMLLFKAAHTMDARRMAAEVAEAKMALAAAQQQHQRAMLMGSRLSSKGTGSGNGNGGAASSALVGGAPTGTGTMASDYHALVAQNNALRQRCELLEARNVALGGELGAAVEERQQKGLGGSSMAVLNERNSDSDALLGMVLSAFPELALRRADNGGDATGGQHEGGGAAPILIRAPVDGAMVGRMCEAHRNVLARLGALSEQSAEGGDRAETGAAPSSPSADPPSGGGDAFETVAAVVGTQ